MWRIVDISSDGAHLSLDTNAMVVALEGRKHRLPLPEINAVCIHAHRYTVSGGLVAKLAESKIPVVLCAANHVPVALVTPVEGNWEQAGRVASQITLTPARHRALWQAVVRRKIAAQAEVLGAFDPAGGAGLAKLARQVARGDPRNVEAQAARAYWPRLFGPDFRRDRHGGGLNAALNYGYTVLRAATCRAIVSSGLLPMLGIHHGNRANNFALADDLMEPFRPLVDGRVRARRDAFGDGLDREGRAALAGLITERLPLGGEKVPVTVALERLAGSFVKVCERTSGMLAYPESMVPDPQADLIAPPAGSGD